MTDGGDNPTTECGGGGDDTLELSTVREEIQRIDAQLVELIALRTYTGNAVARAKEGRDIETTAEKQEEQVMDRVGELASRFDLEEEPVQEIWQQLMEMNKRAQREQR
jgi:chorismate mutase